MQRAASVEEGATANEACRKSPTSRQRRVGPRLAIHEPPRQSRAGNTTIVIIAMS
jgi:hypothetical protein